MAEQKATEDMGRKIFFSSYGPAVTIRIDSWSMFFDLVQGMHYGSWYYRGHEDVAWALWTGIDRVRMKWQGKLGKCLPSPETQGVVLPKDYDFRAYANGDAFDHDLELIGINEFRSLTRGRFDSSFTNLDYLGAMQHYGTYTRFLDFSFSPFVAAFFAFENEECFTQRAVYAININQLHRFSPTMQDAGRISDANPAEDPSSLFKQLDMEYNGAHPALWEVYRKIANLSIGRKEDVLICKDMIPIVLEGVNNRMVAQDGLFMFPLTFDRFDEVLSTMLKLTPDQVNNPVLAKESQHPELERIIDSSVLVKFVFVEALNDSARQVLKKVNLSDRVVYPDLVGVAKSINAIPYEQ